MASLWQPGHTRAMSSLWQPQDWTTRLDELRASEPERKEAPLRRDVRGLGTLLGEVLREQAGDEVFDLVEQLRKLAIERREADYNQDSATANSCSRRFFWCMDCRTRRHTSWRGHSAFILN